MSTIQTLVNTSFNFPFAGYAKFVPSGNAQWSALFSNKNNRKASDESCGTTTTNDESFGDSSKEGFSPNLESPNAWESRVSIDSADTQIGELLNSTLKPKKKTAVDDTKYKTELCKKFEGTGYCPYGKKCKFAHGKEELNEKFLSNKRRYKSKKCNSFHTVMTCPYGSRCLFAHEERPLEEVQQNNYYEKFLFSPDLLSTVTRKRLPCFEKSAQSEVKTIVNFVGTLVDQESEDNYEEIFKYSSLSL